MRHAFALAVLAGSAFAVTAPATPAAAQQRIITPYCLTFYEGPGRYSHQECNYLTFAQCLASAQGRGGQCDQNPEWLARPQPVTKARRVQRQY